MTEPIVQYWDDEIMRGKQELALACGVGLVTVEQWIARKRHGKSAPVSVPAAAGHASRTKDGITRVVPYWTPEQTVALREAYMAYSAQSANPALARGTRALIRRQAEAEAAARFSSKES